MIIITIGSVHSYKFNQLVSFRLTYCWWFMRLTTWDVKIPANAIVYRSQPVCRISSINSVSRGSTYHLVCRQMARFREKVPVDEVDFPKWWSNISNSEPLQATSLCFLAWHMYRDAFRICHRCSVCRCGSGRAWQYRKSHMSRELKTRPYFPWNTGCLIGIIISWLMK